MIETNDIFMAPSGVGILRRLLCLFAAIIFVNAQTASAFHTHDHHDHHDEMPEHEACFVCILAIQDDGEFDLKTDQNDNQDITTLWIDFGGLALPESDPAPQYTHVLRSLYPPPKPYQQADKSRAPPLHI